MIINPYVFAGGPTDPDWPDVATLLHLNGANNSTTFTDETGKTWSIRAGTPVISTAQSVFGSSSAYFNGSGATMDSIDTPYTSDFAIGTGDFTLEFRMRPTADDNYTVISHDTNIVLDGYEVWLANSGRIYVTFNGGNLMSSNGAYTNGAWTAVAVVRESGTLSIYADGTRVATVANSTNFTMTSKFTVGGRSQGLSTTFAYNGYVDELRLTVGVARYSGASYTLDASEFPNS